MTPSGNLFKRCLSAAILLPIALGFIYLGGMAFTLLTLMLTGLMLWEWQRIFKAIGHNKGRFWGGISLLTILAFPLEMVWLRGLHEGLWLIVWLLAVVWAVDIGAYGVGKTIGGPKLAPSISPRKTISGAVGGVIFALIVGTVLGIALRTNMPMGTAFFALPIAAFSIVGDLLISYLKRQVGMKDSGHLIPGHGGILDRMDSLLTATLLMSLLVWGGFALF